MIVEADWRSVRLISDWLPTTYGKHRVYRAIIIWLRRWVLSTYIVAWWRCSMFVVKSRSNRWYNVTRNLSISHIHSSVTTTTTAHCVYQTNLSNFVNCSVPQPIFAIRWSRTSRLNRGKRETTWMCNAHWLISTVEHHDLWTKSPLLFVYEYWLTQTYSSKIILQLQRIGPYMNSEAPIHGRAAWQLIDNKRNGLPILCY